MTKTQHDYTALRIAAVHRETTDAVRLVFEAPEDLRTAFQFKPGQHLPVRATIEGVEQRRTYSICAAPGQPLAIAIKRVDGGVFSNWANATLKPGDTLDAMPPTGRFTLAPSDGASQHMARHVLMIAAGAGITPVYAMIAHALEHEANTRVTLLFGNRSIDSIMFREALEDLKDCHIRRFELVHILSRNDEIEAPLFQGRITGEKLSALSTHLLTIGSIDRAYLCGPGSLIKDTRDALIGLGLPRDRIHHEFFAAGGGAHRTKPVVAASATVQPSTAMTGTEVIAVLDGMRHRFTLQPGQHVLVAAIAAGLRVPYSCRGGMCCTCRAKVTEGRARMTVNYSLEPWEIDKGFVLTCQAVAETPRLVVDYDAM